MPDDFFLPFGGKLNKNNRWVKLAAIIPWWEFEDRYAACFKSLGKGEKALTVRVTLGSLIIQTKLGMPDREIVNQITENPYLQYFLGYERYDDSKPPFDASLMVHFRKRLSKDILIEINELIAKQAAAEAIPKKKDKDDESDKGSDNGSSSNDSSNSESDVDRIVSISQPHIRPIFRGKADAEVEFGSKVMTSVVNGYCFIENDSFNEGIDLKEAVESYKQRFGYYPEAVLADTIFRNRDNRNWLKEKGIQLSGPSLGMPSKDKTTEAAKKQLEKKDSGIRNWIEGSYVVAKRKLGLALIKAKLAETTESSIVLQSSYDTLLFKIASNFLIPWNLSRNLAI